MNQFFIMLTFVFLRDSTALADNGAVSLSLNEIEEQALLTSYQRKAISAEIDAMRNKEEAQRSLLYPKISLDANYKYVTEVPALTFPGGGKAAFGDNKNYSFGPVLTWTIWDFNSTQNSVKGTNALLKSKEAEKVINNKQILLNARLAYFKVQLRIEQQKMIADSLKLAESQHQDIQNKVKAGSLNRIDLLAAHKEVLNLKLQSRQIQSDLSTDLRDLYAIIGKNDFISSSSLIKVDPLAKSLATLSKYKSENLELANLNQHPLVKMFSANAEASNFNAEAIRSNKLPKLSLYAKSSIDYPNGPILENINQNIVGLSLTMPLFEGGRTSHEFFEKQNLALSNENRKEQARRDLMRDWQKASDQLRGFQDKIETYQSLVKESEDRAKLVYSSYRVGRSSFLEVQTANLHALEAKVQATTNDVQILMQLAYLASISEVQ